MNAFIHSFMRKGILVLLALVRKQHLVKVTLYANLLIGEEFRGGLVIKNNYRKHLHMFLSKTQFYNLSRFRLGARKLNVNNINLKHINRSIRFCNYYTHRIIIIIIIIIKRRSGINPIPPTVIDRD